MIIPIENLRELTKASNDCYVRLFPSIQDGQIPVYILKSKLLILADSILGPDRCMALLNGPTATGKSSAIRGLMNELNFKFLSDLLGYPQRKPAILSFDVAGIDNPSSLFYRLNFDSERRVVKEPGDFIKILLAAEKKQQDHCVVIHLRELSRTKSMNQLALLELLQPFVKTEDWSIDISTTNIIADGNIGSGDYQVEELDLALSRRLYMNFFFNYHDTETTRMLLRDVIVTIWKEKAENYSTQINQIIRLTELIQLAHDKGLLSLTHRPNFNDMIKFLSAMKRLGHTSHMELAGHYFFKRTIDDSQHIDSILREVFSNNANQKPNGVNYSFVNS